MRQHTHSQYASTQVCKHSQYASTQVCKHSQYASTQVCKHSTFTYTDTQEEWGSSTGQEVECSHIHSHSTHTFTHSTHTHSRIYARNATHTFDTCVTCVHMGHTTVCTHTVHTHRCSLFDFRLDRKGCTCLCLEMCCVAQQLLS